MVDNNNNSSIDDITSSLVHDIHNPNPDIHDHNNSTLDTLDTLDPSHYTLGPTLEKFQSLNDTLLATIASKDLEISKLSKRIRQLEQVNKTLTLANKVTNTQQGTPTQTNTTNNKGKDETKSHAASPAKPSKASALTASLLNALESTLKSKPQPQARQGGAGGDCDGVSRSSSGASLNKMAEGGGDGEQVREGRWPFFCVWESTVSHTNARIHTHTPHTHTHTHTHTQTSL